MHVPPEPCWLMGFMSPTLMEGKVRTVLALRTLPYTLSLTEVGCYLPWAGTTWLQLHGSEGKNPVTPWKPTFASGAIQDINNA